MKNKIILFSTLLIFSSCSLKYDEAVIVDEKIPEFVFQDTTITRYEDKTSTVSVKAEVLEQYKDTSTTFAKNVEFTAYNDNGEVQTEGECSYLFTDTDKEIYELYDDIKLFDHKEKTGFYADALKWNAKSEQLTSGKSDTVRIETEDTVIHGSGFSASGISKKFNFSGTVTGDIDTK